MLEVKERAENEFTKAYGTAYDYVAERLGWPKWMKRQISPIETPKRVFSTKSTEIFTPEELARLRLGDAGADKATADRTKKTIEGLAKELAKEEAKQTNSGTKKSKLKA